MTEITEQNNILRYLIPKETFFSKVRLGPPEDGGYVVPQFVLEQCSCLFTYGIGYEYRCELEFLDHFKKPIYTFDHTVAHASLPPVMNHTQEGLGFGDNCDDFINHARQRQVSMGVFLKIDIEGFEYEYFLNVDIDRLSDLAIGLCLEVHWLDKPMFQEQFVAMMEVLGRNYTLIHTHANNWGEKFVYEGYEIYNVFELSFIHNRYVKHVGKISESYPLYKLDYANNPAVPDYRFDFFADKNLA